MMGTAFMGYVLPWGLMSFWALTVITNLITVIPVIGADVLTSIPPHMAPITPSS